MRPTFTKAMRETAIRWFMRMQHADADHADRSRFETWLMAHPAHQAAYAEVADLWEDFDSPAQVQLLASALEEKAQQKEHHRKKVKKSITNTFGVLLIVAAGLLGYRTWQAQPLMQIAAVAEVGQIKSQALEDGTRLTLNAGSDVEIIYYRTQRLVKLKRGEAIFEVARDENRPFIVDSGTAKITVLGTRFAVNRLQNLVRISVDHGSVKVEPQTDTNPGTPLILNNGEVAEIGTDGTLRRTDRTATDAFSFQQGIITFDRAGLEEIAETVSRYRKPVVQAHLAPGSDVRITAVLNIKNIEKFLIDLPTMAPVRVQPNAEGTVLIGQQPSSNRQ